MNVEKSTVHNYLRLEMTCPHLDKGMSEQWITIQPCIRLGVSGTPDTPSHLDDSQMHHDEGRKPMVNIILCYFVSVIILKRQNHVWSEQISACQGLGWERMWIQVGSLRKCFGGDGTVLYWIMVVAVLKFMKLR